MPYEKQIRAERNRQFIDRVERLRVERGITKAEMYKGIGVSAAAFSQWKSGAHSISDKAITKAAQFFGVSEIWLLTGIETENAAAQKMAAFYAACKNGNENGNEISHGSSCPCG